MWKIVVNSVHWSLSKVQHNTFFTFGISVHFTLCCFAPLQCYQNIKKLWTQWQRQRLRLFSICDITARKQNAFLHLELFHVKDIQCTCIIGALNVAEKSFKSNACCCFPACSCNDGADPFCSLVSTDFVRAIL